MSIDNHVVKYGGEMIVYSISNIVHAHTGNHILVHTCTPDNPVPIRLLYPDSPCFKPIPIMTNIQYPIIIWSNL